MRQQTAIYTAVSDALWLQREALQTLLYRLGCENLVLSSGSNRWLARADDEVRAALEQLRNGELLRALEVDELTRTQGLGADASLREIAMIAPEPWGTLLTEHRNALRALAIEVQGVTEKNRRLLESGAEAVHRTLAEVTTLLDEIALHAASAQVTYQAALETNARVREFSLLNFLR